MSDPDKKVVEVGSKVAIKIGGKTKILIIVTPQKVNTEIGAISFESPLGGSIIGGKVGDIITYKNPVGQIILVEIIEIE